MTTIAELIAADRNARTALDESLLDKRLAERTGNPDEIAAAEAAENTARKVWYDHYKAAQDAAAQLALDHGVTAVDLRRYLPSY